jgi:hypothetical protein
MRTWWWRPAGVWASTANLLEGTCRCVGRHDSVGARELKVLCQTSVCVGAVDDCLCMCHATAPSWGQQRARKAVITGVPADTTAGQTALYTAFPNCSPPCGACLTAERNRRPAGKRLGAAQNMLFRPYLSHASDVPAPAERNRRPKRPWSPSRPSRQRGSSWALRRQTRRGRWASCRKPPSSWKRSPTRPPMTRRTAATAAGTAVRMMAGGTTRRGASGTSAACSRCVCVCVCPGSSNMHQSHSIKQSSNDWSRCTYARVPCAAPRRSQLVRVATR